ncbi:PilZ domain-containing protein [Methylomonas methanica]|nr:PilZ domain-containing protein [Methylomonas methanica]
MAKVNGEKLNRRVAFRIYEQANLFYRKIDRDRHMQAPENFDALLSNSDLSDAAAPDALPDSQSRENDTLNVNISASGIAFTSKDSLQAGDYLMLRILLLSSMTAIMTCCKVVYCQTQQPLRKRPLSVFNRRPIHQSDARRYRAVKQTYRQE